jgi:hypothetical protein
MNARVTRLLCAALAAGWLLGASAAEALQFKPLLAKDAHALLNGPRAHVLIVEIWSLDCSYCHENTARIVQWRRAHKLPVDVIMISMDSPDQADTLARWRRWRATLRSVWRMWRSTSMRKPCRNVCAPRSTPAGRARHRAHCSSALMARDVHRAGC